MSEETAVVSEDLTCKKVNEPTENFATDSSHQGDDGGALNEHKNTNGTEPSNGLSGSSESSAEDNVAGDNSDSKTENGDKLRETCETESENPLEPDADIENPLETESETRDDDSENPPDTETNTCEAEEGTGHYVEEAEDLSNQEDNLETEGYDPLMNAEPSEDTDQCNEKNPLENCEENEEDENPEDSNPLDTNESNPLDTGDSNPLDTAESNPLDTETDKMETGADSREETTKEDSQGENGKDSQEEKENSQKEDSQSEAKKPKGPTLMMFRNETELDEEDEDEDKDENMKEDQDEEEKNENMEEDKDENMKEDKNEKIDNDVNKDGVEDKDEQTVDVDKQTENTDKQNEDVNKSSDKKDEEGTATNEKEDGDTEETIEMEGEPQIGENPFSEEAGSSLEGHPQSGPPSNSGNEVDPFDPLSGEAEPENIVVEGVPESAPVDESTNGFLDKVNSGTINSAQFMTAMIDLPEKTRGRPRGPYKKRKRDSSESDKDFDEEYEEYKPSRAKSKKKKKAAANARKKRKTTVTRRTTRPRDAMFECLHCDFRTETIGELNIHIFGNHESQQKPTFLDMAEATVAKLAEPHGTSRAALLKTIMADYGHVVEVNTTEAKRILNRSLLIGIELGRVRNGIPGKKGANSIWLPTKETRKSLLNKFTRNPNSLYVDDLDVPDDQLQSSIHAATSYPPRRPRNTKNSGGRGRPAKPVDDDEICVVEEKLTPLAKMKAKAYANAKAALAKKLPAAFLKTGATKMVRIGPGGIVRAEGGKIVTTLGKLTGTTLAPITKKKVAAAEQEARAAQAAASAAAASMSSSMFQDDDDDDLTCTLCLSSFWYKNELLEHMKSTHNIENPEKHLKKPK